MLSPFVSLDPAPSRRSCLRRRRICGSLPRGWCGDGAVFAMWEFRPRASSSSCYRLLQRRHGALRYVGGVRVASRPTQVWWSMMDGFVGGAPVRWRWWSDLRLGGIWRCSFSGLGSVAVRRTTLVFKAWRSSLVVVSEGCDFVFSGDGGGDVVVLGCVFPRCAIVLLCVLCFVLCFI